MTLDRLILDRFLTYRELDYEISKKPLLVQGSNLTEIDQTSNGSGKSGIFTAIEFCIAASNSRDVRDSELVMFGESDARAQLFASCNVRKEKIHIDWDIRVKGSNKLSLRREINGAWEDVSFSNVNDGKKYIMNWFAIEKEDLFNYFIINKSRFKSFFKASNKEKVDLINRFSDASIIDGLEKIDNTDLEASYSGLLSQISKIEGKIELSEEMILDETSRDLKEELNDEMEDIDFNIKEIDSLFEDVGEDIQENCRTTAEIKISIDSKKKEIKGIEKMVTEAEKLVTDFVLSDSDEKIEESLDEIEIEESEKDIENKKLEDIETKKSKIGNLLKELSIEMSGAIECPKCSHEFILDCKHGTLEEAKVKEGKAKEFLKTVEGLEETHREAVSAIVSRIKVLGESIGEITKQSEAERLQRNLLEKSLKDREKELLSIEREQGELEKRLQDEESDYKELNYELVDLERQKKALKDSKKTLKQTDNKELIKQLGEDLTTLKKDKKSKEEESILVGDKIYRRNQWQSNFKQFRMHLANQSLEAIEFHCNRYLAGMGSDLTVKLEGYKVLANGTVKEEITSKIIRNIERTFSSFSGGEQGRLLFAAILANRHMINSTHPYGGLDFLSVDEVFEGVDSIGLKNLVESAKKLQVAVMIITHVTDEEVSDDILLIEKINGESQIKR
tara:strand:+ start:73 stop:2103 length:2031 start_codon:yes stop_codon:yes gene_type:complete